MKKQILSIGDIFEVGPNKFYSTTENFKIFEIIENSLIAADGKNLVLSDFYHGNKPLFPPQQNTKEPQ